MSVAAINTHVADALSRLLQQYKNSPKLQSIVESLAEQIQTLEDTLQDIDISRSVAVATGENLDRIGESLGVVRSSATSDEIYRILILGKIAANVSQGETEAVIATYALLTQASEVTLTEIFPAAIIIFSNGEVDPSLASIVSEYLNISTAAAVSVESFGIYEDPPFGFDGDSQAQGFGDNNNPAIGGKLASKLS